ncbi:unnamed protein product [Pylaiella littoralis]
MAREIHPGRTRRPPSTTLCLQMVEIFSQILFLMLCAHTCMIRVCLWYLFARVVSRLVCLLVTPCRQRAKGAALAENRAMASNINRALYQSKLVLISHIPILRIRILRFMIQCADFFFVVLVHSRGVSSLVCLVVPLSRQRAQLTGNRANGTRLRIPIGLCINPKVSFFFSFVARPRLTRHESLSWAGFGILHDKDFYHYFFTSPHSFTSKYVMSIRSRVISSCLFVRGTRRYGFSCWYVVSSLSYTRGLQMCIPRWEKHNERLYM